MRITVVDADGGVHTVFTQLRAPATTSEPGTAIGSGKNTTGLRVDIAVGAARSKIGMVPGNDPFGTGRRQR
ncbi:MAG TPA: hypothetical protein VIH59_07685, partial [Candidatus Tectomicrobia bacterium]